MKRTQTFSWWLMHLPESWSLTIVRIFFYCNRKSNICGKHRVLVERSRFAATGQLDGWVRFPLASFSPPWTTVTAFRRLPRLRSSCWWSLLPWPTNYWHRGADDPWTLPLETTTSTHLILSGIEFFWSACSSQLLGGKKNWGIDSTGGRYLPVLMTSVWRRSTIAHHHVRVNG